MRDLGPSPFNRWRVDRHCVDLVRPVVEPRPVSISAEPQNLTFDLNRTAVIVVDMQNDFCEPDGWFASKGIDVAPTRRPVPVLQRLLPALRIAGVRVIWLNWGNRADCLNLNPSVLHAGNPDGAGPGYGDPSRTGRGSVLRLGDWGAQVINALDVDPTDIVVSKHRLSGFWDNELDSVLRNLGVTTLMFAGINIDRCLFATLMDASFLGYDCLVIEDATSTVSPQYVTDAVIFLVRLLYGFTITSSAIVAALPAHK